MYAVIRTGGKQYRVTTGDVLRVEKLAAAAEGGTVEFDEVLMVGEGKDVTIGKPLVSGGSVKARVRRLVRGDKVEIIKFKRRKHHMKRQGHRQHYVEVEITDIVGGKGGSSKAAAKPAAESTAPAKKQAAPAAEKPAAKKAESASKPASKAGAAKKPAAKKAPAAKKTGAASKTAAGKKAAGGTASTAKKTATAKKPAAKKSTKSDDK